MSTRPPAATRSPTIRSRLRTLAASLLTASLILYLAASAANRTWVLLNSDVSDLIRRIH
jgi:hypothetical protein